MPTGEPWCPTCGSNRICDGHGTYGEEKTMTADEEIAMGKKLNRMVCPYCGHETLTECAYTTCDACQTVFYASESRDCEPPPTEPAVTTSVTIDGMPIDL